MDIQVDMNKVLERVQAKAAIRIAELEKENAFQAEALDQLGAKVEEQQAHIDELSKLIPSGEKAVKNGKMEVPAPTEPTPV